MKIATKTRHAKILSATVAAAVLRPFGTEEPTRVLGRTTDALNIWAPHERSAHALNACVRVCPTCDARAAHAPLQIEVNLFNIMEIIMNLFKI